LSFGHVPSLVFRRVAGRELPTVARASGAVVWDTEGRRYLDGSGGAVVVNIGHGRQEVAAAMARQATAAAYVHGTQFTSGVLEEYARRLAGHAPGDCKRLYLLSGGSEATETAIKLARAYHLARGEPGRHKVVGRTTSYHGNTIAALSVSGRPTLQAPYLPMLAEVPRAAVPFCYHCPLDREYPSCTVACADDLEAVIAREGAATIAAFIAEPVLGASAGAAVPPEEYTRRVRETCRRHGIVYIDDEVMCGFGRTGRWFGIEWSGEEPDLVTCGKGMGGGYMPVGAVLASEQVVKTVEGAGGFVHGFTFSHHPVTAAACLATLEILERERLVERAQRMGERALARLQHLRERPAVGDVRGRGLLLAVELVADRAARRPFPRAQRRAENVAARAFAEGLIVYPSAGCATGTEGDAILLAPPLVASEDETDEMIRLLDRAIAAEFS
jgi:adenosylmethionine-8-amino-7-oxononanoate aminotransferase